MALDEWKSESSWNTPLHSVGGGCGCGGGGGIAKGGCGGEALCLHTYDQVKAAKIEYKVWNFADEMEGMRRNIGSTK